MVDAESAAVAPDRTENDLISAAFECSQLRDVQIPTDAASLSLATRRSHSAQNKPNTVRCWGSRLLMSLTSSCRCYDQKLAPVVPSLRTGRKRSGMSQFIRSPRSWRKVLFYRRKSSKKRNNVRPRPYKSKDHLSQRLRIVQETPLGTDFPHKHRKRKYVELVYASELPISTQQKEVTDPISGSLVPNRSVVPYIQIRSQHQVASPRAYKEPLYIVS